MSVVAFPSRGPLTLRRERHADTAGRPSLLLGAAIGGSCLVVALRRDTGGTWTEGFARLPAGAVRLPAADILAATAFAPARNATAAHLGLLGPGGNPLKDQVEALLNRHGRNVARDRGSYRMAEGRRAPPVSRTGLDALGSLGFDVVPDTVDLFALAAARPAAIPEPSGAEAPDPAFLRDFPVDVPLRTATEFLAEWREAGAALLREGTAAMPSPEHWDGRLCGHLAAPGTAGLYRRQAAALHPLVLPALAHDPGLSALVDAGRPFEAALAVVLRRVLDPAEADGLSAAKLRRLRGYAGDFPPHRLPQFLSIVARLGVERLPGSPEGWTEWVRAGALRLDSWSRLARLDLPTLMPAPFDGVHLDQRLFLWLGDAAERCGQTLVAPLLGLRLDGDEANHLAMRLLYGGGDLTAALDRCKRWHAGLANLEADLPHPDAGLSWPALIAPHERFGIQVRALTTPAELRAEGASGGDGLDHCVGGYGPRCHQGVSHILSIRRRTPDGWERLSTAEVTVRERAAASGDEIVGIRQHRGLRNAEPSPEADRALDRVLDGIGRGEIPVDPEARRRRPAASYGAAVDWSKPEAIAASMRAWRPHLPRRYARLDADGLRTALTAIGAGILELDPAAGTALRARS